MMKVQTNHRNNLDRPFYLTEVEYSAFLDPKKFATFEIKVLRARLDKIMNVLSAQYFHNLVFNISIRQYIRIIASNFAPMELYA
jgi:hypothetical protein